MKLWLPLLVLASISPVASNAAEGGQGYGIGMHSCGEFAKAYMTNPALAEGVYFAWAEGFMSGLNFMAAVAKMPSRQIEGGDASMRRYQAYIRDFCNEHPLAPYSDAATQLWNSLPAMRPDSR